jgi:hypothetical protein
LQSHPSFGLLHLRRRSCYCPRQAISESVASTNDAPFIFFQDIQHFAKIFMEQTPIHTLSFGTAFVSYAACQNGITQEIFAFMSKILLILLVFGSSKEMDRRVRRIILLYAPVVMLSCFAISSLVGVLSKSHSSDIQTRQI